MNVAYLSIASFTASFCGYSFEGTELALLLIIFTNILLVVMLLLWLYASKLMAKAREARHNRLTAFYENLVSSYLEEKNARKSIMQKLHQQLTSKERARLLVNVIILYKGNFSGEYGQSLNELFTSLDLHRYSMRKLRSAKWNKRAEGIQELTRMTIRDAAPDLVKFLDARERDVRMLAVSALAELSGYDALNYIEERNYELSEWEQLVLLERFLSLPKANVPDVARLLRSQNDSLVLLALHLVKHLNQYHAGAEVILLLRHSNVKVKLLAIEAAAALLLTECIPVLVQVFPSENRTVQVSIIGTMGEIGSSNDIDFIIEQVNSGDHEIALKGLEAIGKIEPSAIRTMAQSGTGELQKLIAHAADSRL